MTDDMICAESWVIWQCTKNKYAHIIKIVRGIRGMCNAELYTNNTWQILEFKENITLKY